MAAGAVASGRPGAGWWQMSPRAPGGRVNESGERDLLHAVAAGDADALGHLYRLRGAELLAYLAGVCRDEQVAQELLQDTMLKVWRHATSYRGDASVRTWLFAIARRTARDYLRRPDRGVVPDAVLGDHPAPQQDEPEAGALAKAGTQALLAAFGELSPLHREVLLLVALHGLSVRETAGVLEVAEGTVKSRLHHARRALAAVLGADQDREQRP
jgi:RNA polymerase sigma-70 factor, ECF subfamily